MTSGLMSKMRHRGPGVAFVMAMYRNRVYSFTPLIVINVDEQRASRMVVAIESTRSNLQLR